MTLPLMIAAAPFTGASTLYFGASAIAQTYLYNKRANDDAFFVMDGFKRYRKMRCEISKLEESLETLAKMRDPAKCQSFSIEYTDFACSFGESREDIESEIERLKSESKALAEAIAVIAQWHYYNLAAEHMECGKPNFIDKSPMNFRKKVAALLSDDFVKDASLPAAPLQDNGVSQQDQKTVANLKKPAKDDKKIERLLPQKGVARNEQQYKATKKHVRQVAFRDLEKTITAFDRSLLLTGVTVLVVAVAAGLSGGVALAGLGMLIVGLLIESNKKLMTGECHNYTAHTHSMALGCRRF